MKMAKYEDSEIVRDSIAGTWEHENDERKLIFDGLGKVTYDNGKCLATNCYARARFNILDTESWMETIRKKVVGKVATKADLW